MPRRSHNARRPRPFRTTLRDGTRVLIRPVRPDDKHLLADGFRRLSDVSRYRRFLRTAGELSAEQLRFFTEIDYADHMAWLAIDLGLARRPAVGVARYIRFEEDPAKAEVAVTVVDSHQGRGLGTVLLSALSRSAVAHGIATFVATVLTENEPMLRLFREMGATTVTPEDPGIVLVEIPVPGSAADLPQSPMVRVFKVVGRLMAASGSP